MSWRPTAGSVAKRLLDPELLERVRSFDLPDDGHGWDRFGMHRDWVALGLAITAPLYNNYFRVVSHDIHHASNAGQCVLASNHSGTIPLDAMMIWNDLVRMSSPPLVPRVIIDHFVNMLPGISVLFSRVGAVGGSRGNFHEILSGGESILVFPEGVPGIGKPFKKRYQLQGWREGHAELAIRHGVPVVPIAVIGAEEQMPQIGRINGIRAFGSPYLPLTASPVPLPVRYHIWYGEPIPLHKEHPMEASNDPTIVKDAARRVGDAVQELIFKGLREREGIFR